MPRLAVTAFLLLLHAACQAGCISRDAYLREKFARTKAQQELTSALPRTDAQRCSTPFYDSKHHVGLHPPPNWQRTPCDSLPPLCIAKWEGGIAGSIVLYGLDVADADKGLDTIVDQYLAGDGNTKRLVDSRRFSLPSGQPARFLLFSLSGDYPIGDRFTAETWTVGRSGGALFVGMFYSDEQELLDEIFRSAASLCLGE